MAPRAAPCSTCWRPRGLSHGTLRPKSEQSMAPLAAPRIALICKRNRGARGKFLRRARLSTRAILVASFPVLPRTRFTFKCDNWGGEHFETGKAWSETSRELR